MQRCSCAAYLSLVLAMILITCFVALLYPLNVEDIVCCGQKMRSSDQFTQSTYHEFVRQLDLSELRFLYACLTRDRGDGNVREEFRW